MPVFQHSGILSASTAQATTINASTGTATYTIISDTNGGLDADYTGTAFIVTSLPTGTFAHTASLSDGISTTTDWVGPNVNQSSEATSGGSIVSGTTVYTVTFNLTGFNLSTASLAMALSADDFVNSVVLNSTTIFTATTGEKTSGMWTHRDERHRPDRDLRLRCRNQHPTFTVANSTGDGATSCCGPTALMAAVDITANSTVPEPSTLGLSGLGLVGLAIVLRRRRGA